jgi:HSP20 family protein
MTMKRSFFERLSGNATFDDAFDDDIPVTHPAEQPGHKDEARTIPLAGEPVGAEGQLPVDVHQTASDIVIRAFVAGVRPDELNISITRDLVEISGSRAEREQVSSQDSFIHELFWGSFARAISLPQEVDVDAATAASRDGLLTITLPKLDKTRQTKLRVKSG